MTADFLPLCLNRLKDAVADLQHEMEQSDDVDDLFDIHLAALDASKLLMHVDDLALARAGALIGKRG